MYFHHQKWQIFILIIHPPSPDYLFSWTFRRLLQIGGENQGAGYLFSHVQAPTSGPVSAPSPSAFISSPPEGAPSPFYSRPTPQRSPLRQDPSVVPPHPLKFRPATQGAEHDHSLRTPSRPVHKHSWTTYGLVAAGVAAFLIISAAGALYCRAKKVGTVKPWVTGLSGQLQKAFVTGMLCLYFNMCVSRSLF